MKIIEDVLNKIVLEFHRHHELESRMDLFVNNIGELPLIEKITLHEDGSEKKIEFSPEDSASINTFLIDAFNSGKIRGREINSDVKPLELHSDDGLTLTLSYSNYGDPYDSGINFCLGKTDTYDTIISCFAERSELYHAQVVPLFEALSKQQA